MAYLATWGVFVQGDGLDPIDVARAADKLHNPDNATWKISDLDTGEVTVVDLREERIINCE